MQYILTIGIGCNKDGKYFDSTLKSIIQLLEKYNFLDKTEICICNDAQHQCGDFLIAKKYQQFYNNFRLFDNKINKGISYTYHQLLMNAKGKYFMAFDSDDIIADFDINKAISFLDQNKKYSGSYGIKKLVTLNGEGSYTGANSDLFNFGFYCNHNAMILNTQLARQYGGYFPTFLTFSPIVSSDICMWITHYIYKDLYFDPTLRCYGRLHENNHSSKNSHLYSKQFYQIKQGLLSLYKNGTRTQNLKIIILGIIKNDTDCLKNVFLNSNDKHFFYSKYVFKHYYQFLKKHSEIKSISELLLQALLYNNQIKDDILSIILDTNQLNLKKQQILSLKKNIKLYDNKQWFETFF